MCDRISSGREASGHGGWGEASVGGGMGSMRRVEKLSTSWRRLAGREEWAALPCREWWAGLGTVTGALDGLVWVGFDFLKAEGGKCLFLYALSTSSSSCDLPQHTILHVDRQGERPTLNALR